MKVLQNFGAWGEAAAHCAVLAQWIEAGSVVWPCSRAQDGVGDRHVVGLPTRAGCVHDNFLLVVVAV